MSFSSASLFSKCGNSELEHLAALSVRLGSDPALVQAASGNTSVKLNGSLWIKASGKWLAEAQRERIFVSLDLAVLRTDLSKLRTGLATLLPDYDADECFDTRAGLCPSIETAMHALLPHRVVLHVHSVNTIAWAVRQDGCEQLTERLRGLRWQWIPHTPSGRPLAHEIAKVTCAAPATDVFVLANHGLVVCGPCCDSAEALLQEVESRLAIAPRVAPEPDCATLGAMAHALDWKLPATPGLHALGTDRLSRTILTGGVLYPCQAIFLASSRAILSHTDCLHLVDQYRQQRRNLPPFFILKEGGVILSKQISRAEYAMLIGLLQVVQRIGPAAPIRYLTPDEVTGVLNADAYQYRTLVEAGQKSAV